MKRLKYSLIFFVLIIGLVLISMRVTGLSFSQDHVHFAIEKAMHYGPSDEILYRYNGKDGKGLVIGKCGEKGLSVTYTKRYLGVLYKADPDFLDRNMEEYSQYIPVTKEIGLYHSPSKDLLFGICFNDQVKELKVEAGTWNDIMISNDVILDNNGFFIIKDLGFSMPQDEHREVYYFYAESTDEIEGTDIRINSNMARGLIADRKELDKMIPERDGFLTDYEKYYGEEFSGEYLNKINAGIKQYTGIDFFAYQGWTNGETLRLTYNPRIWSEKELVLTFVKDKEGFYPDPTDENMDAAAIGWLMTNYGGSYYLNNLHSDKVSYGEENGIKLYQTMLSCNMKPKFPVSAEFRSDNIKGDVMNVEIVVEADLNDHHRPWKLSYLDGLTGKLRDINELYIDVVPDGEISENMITYFNEIFSPTVKVSPGHIKSTEISCFFTSFYDDPKNIDIYEFLKYCPLGTLVEDEAEFQKIKEISNSEFLSDSLNKMNTPVWRYRKKDLDDLLTKYAGITSNDLTGKGMEKEMLIYADATDSYYNFTSDMGAGSFEVVRGEKANGVYHLWNKIGNCLTLRRANDGLKILSFTEE